MSRSRDIADSGQKINFLDNVVEDLNTALTSVEGSEIKSTGETGTVKYLRIDGDNSCSWQTVATEGTNILSTGESGGSKFLREDGDNSCSWQTIPATEGTAILSTGENGGSKFLREDGDNSCSWQTIPSAIPSGMIAPFGMNSAPTGWLVCDGSAVSRSTYSDLYSAIGTTWGTGDGNTTFNVPDLEGAFLRGTGAHNSNNMANGSDFAGPSVGSFENDQVQQMNHRHAGATAAGAGYNKFYGNGGVRHWVSASVQSESYGSPRRGDETRPFNAGVKYCIKY